MNETERIKAQYKYHDQSRLIGDVEYLLAEVEGLKGELVGADRWITNREKEREELLGWVSDVLEDYKDQPALGFEAIRLLVKGTRRSNEEGD